MYKAGKKHYCRGLKKKGIQQCFACLKLIKNNDNNVHVDKYNGKDVCDQTQGGQPVKCANCNIECVNASCLKAHSKKEYCQHRGFYFKCCSSFKYVGSNVDQETLRKTHNCNDKICRYCYKTFNVARDNHVCLLQMAKAQKRKPKLMVFDFETTCKPSPLDCNECALKEANFVKKNVEESGEEVAQTRKNLEALLKQKPELKSKLRCDAHKDATSERSFHEVIGVSIVFELDRHGVFHRVEFYAPQLQHQADCRVTRNVFKYDYFPDCVKDKAKVRRIKMNANTRARKRKALERSQDLNVSEVSMESVYESVRGSKFRMPDMSDKKHWSVVDKMLFFITQGQFNRSVMLAHNLSAFDSQPLLEGMHKKFLTPKVLMSGLKVTSINLDSHKITFLDTLRYVPTSLKNFPKAFGLDVDDKGYFPYDFCTEENFDYDEIGPPPTKHFITFGDSAQTIAEKKEYLDQLRAENYRYVLRDELQKYMNLDTEILCKGVCAYIKQCYEFQTRLILQDPALKATMVTVNEQGAEEIGLANLVNPFGKGLSTVSSYIFYVFRW